MKILILIALLAPLVHADPVYIYQAENAGPASEFYTNEPVEHLESMPVDTAIAAAPAVTIADCYDRDAACQAAHPGTEGYRLCANYTIQCENRVRGH